MAMRRNVSGRRDRKRFSRTARKVNRRNAPRTQMRGGIRL